MDGGEHLLDVADHRVVRLSHDRCAGIGVDGEDVLGCPAADHVLNRAADAARNVQIRSDPRPGLAALIAVWPPAEAGYRTRAADRATEQAGEFLQRGEALGAAHAATAADDDACLCERDLSGIGLDLGHEAHSKILLVERWRKGMSRDLGAAGR